MVTQSKAEVLSNKALDKHIYQLSLLAPVIARSIKPGQFVNILCGEGRDYILRRPFSVYRKSGGSIEILFQVVGRGTQFLSELKPHSRLDVVGPLGRPFELKKRGRVLLVAGGMGIAPLRLLADELSRGETGVYFALGARSKGHLPFRQGLREICEGIFYATEDGSLGNRGKITDFLPGLLEKARPDEICSCGPQPMLKIVAELARKANLSCQVSLEKMMACGLGVCLSCVVPVRTGRGQWEYRRVCREGPVFDAAEVYWDET